MYRPSSLRDRERTRPPLSNVFETEEKRQKVQKEIEKAQKLILADALVGADGDIPSKLNEDFSEGEELEKVCFVLLQFKIYCGCVRPISFSE